MNSQKRSKAIVIAGPTASGKTQLGIDLALGLKGEIINADSMQVYRGLDIGTAKPGIEERKGIIHHLIDVADPDEEFNTAIYRSTRENAPIKFPLYPEPNRNDMDGRLKIT